jgi:hypothetical protein
MDESHDKQQTITQDEINHGEVKVFLFSRLLKYCPPFLRHLSWLILVGISPEVPVSLGKLFSNRGTRRAGIFGAAMTFLACFVVILVWCSLTQTLRGNQPGRIYFLNDYANILNYTLICPLYVGLSCALITTVLRGWSKLAEFAEPDSSSGRRLITAAGVIFSAIFFASLSTSNYIAECLNPKTYSLTAWYVTEVIDGRRVIGALGIYYAVINFSLLVIIIVAAYAFLSLFVVSVQVGDRLKKWNPVQPFSFDQLSKQLSTFTEAYLISKLLAAAIMLNAFTYKWARPYHSINFWLFGAAITFFGVFFVSFPRYYIELEWLQLKFRMMQQNGAPAETPSYDDLRPFRTRLIVYALDGLLIGGFIFSFWFQ